MKLNQEKYDKLIAIASSMNLLLDICGTNGVTVETHHGVNAGNADFMSLSDIEAFLDTMFEHEISYMGIEKE